MNNWLKNLLSELTVEVHPHVALFATRGKASPCLKEVFQPCFMADSKEVFQPCFMADFKEQMFL